MAKLNFAISAAVAAFLLTATPHVAIAEEYRLGVSDKLAIRVAEWQVTEGTFREWTAVTGEYTVGPAGTLSIPFVGELPAENQTTAEIAAAIGAQLKNKFGLKQAPEASVEVMVFRPFFISGAVQTPGQYPFVPRLTVIKTVSIAGGHPRSVDGGQRIERDFINAQGGYEVSADEQARLAIRRERLRAEGNGESDFVPPEPYAKDKVFASIVADEKAILDSRQRRLDLRLKALNDLKALLENEIVSLEKKRTVQLRQIDLAKKELTSVSSLSEKGLVVNTRLLGVERSIADMEGQLLDLETAILRVKQDISKATQDATDLENAAEAEVALERQTVEAQLKAASLKLETSRSLMSEALAVAPESGQHAGAAGTWSYTIVRTNQDGKTETISADENTPVKPGDVVKVGLAGAALK